jgi:Cd2+/Zn2+-exporting ATPase
LDLVQNASSKKAPTEQFITKFARLYTPIVVGIAFVLAIVPALIIPGATFSQWIYRALIFLVVSCPCALVISIPLGYFGGIGGASKQGILMKGSNYLEALNRIDTIVFDKTGTLTKGQFKVMDIISDSSFTKADILEAAALAESHSTHPIALSIIKTNGKIDGSVLTDVSELAGLGVLAMAKGKRILAGNEKLMNQFGFEVPEVKGVGSIVHIAIDQTYAGYLVIEDEIKPDAIATIDALKKMGIQRIVMLTGDSKAVGDKNAKVLGIPEVFSNLLPADKVELVEKLSVEKKTTGKLVFVGDGINDAPVLMRADVGIAMGALGSDAAIEAADIVLMTDEPSKIISAIRLSRFTQTVVYQNIALAFGVKLIVLILGAFGLASMWEAVFADVGVALLAVFNALRILHSKA